MLCIIILYKMFILTNDIQYRENTMKVNVFFRDLDYELIETSPSYSVSSSLRMISICSIN